MPPTSQVEAFSIKHAQICDGTTSFLANLAAAVAVGLDMYGVNSGSLAADVGNYENPGNDQVLSRWYWLNFATVSVQAGFLSFPLYAQISGQPLSTVAVSAVSEVQTLSTVGGTAGTFTLTFRGATTTPIAYNATAAAIQTALQALSTIGAGNATATGGPASTAPVVITFAGTLALTPVDLITANVTGVTGATGGVVTRTTAGQVADTQYGIDLWHEDSMNVAPKPMLISLPSKDNLGAIRRLVIGLYRCQFGPIGFDGPAYKDGFKVNYEATALPSAADETGLAFADGKRRVGRLLSIL